MFLKTVLVSVISGDIMTQLWKAFRKKNTSEPVSTDRKEYSNHQKDIELPPRQINFASLLCAD